MNSPLWIVGPCSAESREQVLVTAQSIAKAVDRFAVRWIFRAGVWKPRTSPHTFQGVGEEGLAWLAEVKRTFGIDIATEVATPEHVEAALKAGIDYLWIGARTSANPLAVEAIAKRLRVTGYGLRGIFIKNPVNADADLWLGNIERLERTEVPVIAVHRGCNHQPCWAMAHKVRTARPDIPMLLDPSHMSGDAAKVPALLGKIAELGLDGAMVEVHAHPKSALSDKAQQIRPDELMTALQVLNDATKSLNDEPSASNDVELNWLRAEIDELDETLWSTVAARMDVSRRIGEWKKEHGVAPLQPERYQQIVERLRGTGYGLSDEFMLRVWELIHEESLKQQK